MTTLALDPKPWVCSIAGHTNCPTRYRKPVDIGGDPYARFEPRPEYSQNREDYS